MAKNLTSKALLAQIDCELDEAKRKDLVRQAEAIFEIGIYDVVRFDTFWLEK